MNKQIIKERQQTPWLILGGCLIVILMMGLLFWLSRQQAQTDTLVSDSISLQSLPTSPTSTILTVSGRGKSAIGELAPNFTLETLNGQEVTLSDLRGQPVMINFWTSWCAPCRLEMPVLQRTHETHQAEELIILAVNLTAQDTVSEAKNFVEEFQLTMPVLLDEAGVVSEIYQLLGLPTTVFVDRQGVIKRIHLGPMTEMQIDQFVTEILE